MRCKRFLVLSRKVNEMSTSDDVKRRRGCKNPLCTNITVDALPEVEALEGVKNSNTGVSTLSMSNRAKTGDKLEEQSAKETTPSVKWYALRLAYANESNIKKVFDTIVSDSNVKVKGFFPTFVKLKKENGKIKKEETCRLKNIFFLQGTFDQIKYFVYDNYRFKHLRFYSRHYHDNRKDEPIVIPDREIISLQIICNSNVEDIMVIDDQVKKFKEGQKVIITEGDFAGVSGIVARFAGHQRVGIVIGSSFTVTTAYIPTAFWKLI